MSSKVVIKDNVWAFLDKASTLYGEVAAQGFAQSMHGDCLERGITSPIEHLFWIAVNAIAAAHRIDIDPPPKADGDEHWRGGLYLTPQKQVGSYRVDFVLKVYGFGPDEFFPFVAVELDGHDFHDKDKRQRSYEKARDRELVKAGYKVLHYTGSDVVADPFKVAHEAMCMADALVSTGWHDYRSEDPLGQGY